MELNCLGNFSRGPYEENLGETILNLFLLFDLILYVPVNNLSVTLGRVSLG